MLCDEVMRERGDRKRDEFLKSLSYKGFFVARLSPTLEVNKVLVTSDSRE